MAVNYLESLWDLCINRAYHSENVTEDEEDHHANDCVKYNIQYALKKKR